MDVQSNKHGATGSHVWFQNAETRPPPQITQEAQESDPPREFKPFLEFPTFHLLRQANNDYTAVNRGKALARDDVTGQLLPYPSPSLKKDTFKVEDYAHIDAHATQVQLFVCTCMQSKQTEVKHVEFE